MKIKYQKLKIIFSIFLVVFILSTLTAKASVVDELFLEALDTMPQNSIERYSYCKSLESGKSYLEVLKEEILARDSENSKEKIEYRTVSKKVADIGFGNKKYPAYIRLEIKVLTKEDGKVTKLLDYGRPIVFVTGLKASWNGEDYNIDVDKDRIRVSSTGEFFLGMENISVGKDIIDIGNENIKTKLMTIKCYVRY
ncbi:hypothetical protein [Peptoniphilus duerdenii]|uniref:hypothetical protein n=1 Tax=Peptoniphilus duerdenii TaxID=507750 RepID=UPI00288A98B3|nr:hypothetical protein [Peptoniphilus duerdenii]